MKISKDKGFPVRYGIVSSAGVTNGNNVILIMIVDTRRSDQALVFDEGFPKTGKPISDINISKMKA
jgi:hypothetical protein